MAKAKTHAKGERASARPILCCQRVRVIDGNLPPGWIRATRILLNGMERLRAMEDSSEITKPQE